MNNFKAVLFDLDGTLIDSEHFYFSNWAPILSDAYGLQITFEDWISNFAGHTLAHNVAMLNKDFNLKIDVQEMWNATRASYAKADMRSIRLMPHAQELLEFVKSKGLTAALVTSSYKATVDIVLGEHKLLDYFSFFVTRESVDQPKPNPEPYLLATKKLAMPSEHILVVEDTRTGCTAAKEAGLFCVGVSKQEVERERLAHADRLAYSLKEVESLFF